MGDTPVGAGWISVGDVVVTDPQAPYKDVPLTASERPASSGEQVVAVLPRGVELRVEAVRGSRARVRGLQAEFSEAHSPSADNAVEVEGWIRLCATDGTPFVQPLWMSRQQDGFGVSAAAACGGGTEGDLRELLETHGVRVDAASGKHAAQLAKLQRRLRRREAMLEPRGPEQVVIRADFAVLKVRSEAGDLLIETHRQSQLAAAAGVAAAATDESATCGTVPTGRLPHAWRIAGESWVDCAQRLLREEIGLAGDDLQLLSFEELPLTDDCPVPAPMLEGLELEGERRLVLCQLQRHCAAAAQTRGLSRSILAARPFTTSGRQGADEDGAGHSLRRYWSWWSESLWQAVQQGRSRRPGNVLQCSHPRREDMLWLARAFWGDRPDLSFTEVSSTMRMGAESLLLVVEAHRADGSANAPAVLLLSDVTQEAPRHFPTSPAAASRASQAGPWWDRLAAGAARPFGCAVEHPSGHCFGLELDLRAVAWNLPELSAAGASLLTTFRGVLQACTLPGGTVSQDGCHTTSLTQSLVPALPALLGRLELLLRRLMGSCPGRCEHDLFEFSESIFASSGLSAAMLGAQQSLQAFRGDARFEAAHWRPLGAPAHGCMEASHVLVDAMGSVWMAGGAGQYSASSEREDAPGGLLWDLATLVSTALLEGVVLPVTARSFATLATSSDAGSVARWLGVDHAVASRLLQDVAASPQKFLAEPRSAIAEAAACCATATERDACCARLRLLVAQSEERVSEAATQATLLSSALVTQLPRWGEVPADVTEVDPSLGVPWVAAAWSVQAKLLGAGASALGDVLSRRKRRLAQVDTSPLLLLVPMLKASLACLESAAPWQKAWVSNHVDCLAKQIALSMDRARASFGPVWSPMWCAPRSLGLADGVAFEEGMRVVLAPSSTTPRDRSSTGRHDPTTDEGSCVTCGGPGDEPGPGVQYGWPCAFDGISMDDGWRLWEWGNTAPVAEPPPEEIKRAWTSNARTLSMSCAFCHVIEICAGEGCQYLVEEAPPSRRPSTMGASGGTAALTLAGRHLGTAKLREDGGAVRVRLEQRTLCSPPCRLWEHPERSLQVDLGGGQSTTLACKLSAPFFCYPAGSRLALVSHDSGGRGSTGSAPLALQLRECTVLKPLADGYHEVRFDSDAEDASILAKVVAGNHRPAGIFRYSSGQRIIFVSDGRWTEATVMRCGVGNRHLLRELPPSDHGDTGAERSPANESAVWVDLNTMNHMPAWLGLDEFETQAQEYGKHLLAQYAAISSPISGSPLDVASQPLRLRPRGGSGKSDVDCWQQLFTTLLPSTKRHLGLHSAPCFSVIGEPRVGKTLLLYRLATLCLRQAMDFIPLLLSAKALASAMEADAEFAGDLIAGYLERSMAKSAAAELAMLRQAIYSRRCLFLLDDLDAAGPMRPRIEAYLLRLARCGHRVVYTMRSAPSARTVMQATYTHLELLPLDERGAQQLAEARLPSSTAACLAAGATAGNGKLAILCAIAQGSPGVLQMLMDLAQGQHSAGFPDAAEAYHALFMASLGRAGLGSDAASSRAWRVLETVAFEMHRQRRSTFSEGDIRALLAAEELRSWEALRAALAAGRLPLLAQDAQSEAYRFVDMSLQEYLFASRASKHVGAGASAGASQALPGLRVLLSEPWWARSLEFLALGFKHACSELLKQGLASWEPKRGLIEATALYLAVEKNLPAVVQLLLKQGAAPGGAQLRSRHMYGSVEESPLAQAAGRGAVALVDLLLEHGAQPGGFQCVRVSAGGERQESTPLFCAAENNHVAAAAALLRRGAPADGVQRQSIAGAAGNGCGALASGTRAGGGRGQMCVDVARSEEMCRLLREAAPPRPRTGGMRPGSRGGTAGYPRSP